ncbi:MAG: hypothetical protein ACXVCP_11075 [Bdellovibrio sp.]
MKLILLGIFSVLSLNAEAACEGISDMCAYVGARGERACNINPGCSWDEDSNYCSGIAPVCNMVHDSITCKRVSGCTWGHTNDNR